MNSALDTPAASSAPLAFPLFDAFLLQPEEGKDGRIAVCTNTLAPGMVVNEIPLELRRDVSVLGSLIVNRDGAERMILNSLVHPTLETIVLFGEETASFRPSTNLLNALMHGYDAAQEANQIAHGVGVAHHYPSISPEILAQFRERVTVLPLFAPGKAKDTIAEYLQWLEPRVPPPVFAAVATPHIRGGKIYFDSLCALVHVLSEQTLKLRSAVQLDPREFQHLKPLVIRVEDKDSRITVPFRVYRERDAIALDLDVGSERLTLSGQDSFLMAYSLMEYLNEKGLTLEPLQQLVLGAELSRIEMQIKNKITFPSSVESRCAEGERTRIPLAPRTNLKADKVYYYTVFVKDDSVCVQSMTYDTCKQVFELRGRSLVSLLERIAQEDRFDNYDQQFLHRVDVGIETARAAIARAQSMQFFQDFRSLSMLNMTRLPRFIVEGDSFLGVHKGILTRIYTEGLTAPHADAHKGPARSGIVLAVFRNAAESLCQFPALYAQGSASSDSLREDYCKNLLNPQLREGMSVGHGYTYGHRTRTHFGRDQLEDAVRALQEHPGQSCVIQRFDPLLDMTLAFDAEKNSAGDIIRQRLVASEDPCLTHDIYWIAEGTLHAFHIARAHNTVNAYPENIFGLHDAYDHTIAERLGIPLGDMFMLSSRANILLLNEEQRTRKIIAEPSKPVGDLDTSIGPFNLAQGYSPRGVGYCELPLERVVAQPEHPCLAPLLGFRGVNILEKAIDYLVRRGVTHNNPILSSYDAQDPERTPETQRLVFYQCNAMAGVVHATAVFLGSRADLGRDIDVSHYLATQYAERLKLPLGDLFLFHVPCMQEE